MARNRSKTDILSPKVRERLAQAEACEASGETLKSYAKRHGLSVDALYQAKKVARQQGLIPPYRGKPVPQTAKPMKALPMRSTRFIPAVRKADAPLEEIADQIAWRLRFTGGEVLESGTRLSLDETLALIDKIRGRS